jgi:hypothetical protein
MIAIATVYPPPKPQPLNAPDYMAVYVQADGRPVNVTYLTALMLVQLQEQRLPDDISYRGGLTLSQPLPVGLLDTDLVVFLVEFLKQVKQLEAVRTAAPATVVGE